MPAFQDLTDQRFDKLVVRFRVANVGKHVAWRCECDCGNWTTATSNHLRRRNTKSCGCLNHVKKLPDVDWDDPVSRNIRRRELYADKVANGYKRIRSEAYYKRKREREIERRAEDPEKAKEQGRQKTKRYRTNNPEKTAADLQRFLDANPGYMRAANQRRRALVLNAPKNDLTLEQWREIKAAHGHRCVYCGRKMKRLTQDHIIPLSKGGSHTADNVVPACQSCNSRKHAGPILAPIQQLLFVMNPPKDKKTKTK